MPGKVSFSFSDFSGEKSNVSFETDDITSANIDTVASLNGALTTALQGVTLGNINKRTFFADDAVVEAGNPPEGAAQREMKWRVELADSVTGERIYREIPTADISITALLVAGTDLADMAHAAWVSLKGAIDGNYNNPKTGNSLLVIGARLVGRNL